MSDLPFDRLVNNLREAPLSTDRNQQTSQIDRTVRFLAKSMFSDNDGLAVSGFIGNGFAIQENSPAAMSVLLKAGLGFQDLPGDVPDDIDGIGSLDDLESYKPLPVLSDIEITIPTAPVAPNSRIDIIEVRADRVVDDNQSRRIFNEATRAFVPTGVNKNLGFVLDATDLGSVTTPDPSTAPISLKVGAEGNPGVAPSTTPGYVKVAEVLVQGDVTTIVNADIFDARDQLKGRTKTLVVAADAAQPETDGSGVPNSDFSNFGWTSRNTVNMNIWCPIPGLTVGDEITAVRVHLRDSGQAITCTLFENPIPSLTLVEASDDVDSAASSSDQTVSLTNIDFNSGRNTVRTGYRYTVHVQGAGLSFPAGMNFYGLEIDIKEGQ